MDPQLNESLGHPGPSVVYGSKMPLSQASPPTEPTISQSGPMSTLIDAGDMHETSNSRLNDLSHHSTTSFADTSNMSQFQAPVPIPWRPGSTNVGSMLRNLITPPALTVSPLNALFAPAPQRSRAETLASTHNRPGNIAGSSSMSITSSIGGIGT